MNTSSLSFLLRSTAGLRRPNMTFLARSAPFPSRILTPVASFYSPMNFATRSPSGPVTSPPSSSQSSPKMKLSPTMTKIASWLAWVLGYSRTTGMAVVTSNDMYAQCAKHYEEQKRFYVDVCKLPDNLATWFLVTHLHVWMLMVRFRAEKYGRSYNQQLVNRFFEDTEKRIRESGVITSRVVTQTLRDLLAQFQGGVVAYDEGMCKGDPVLAAAIWRNILCNATQPTQPNQIALMVQYIRKELKALESIQEESMRKGKVSFGTLSLNLK